MFCLLAYRFNLSSSQRVNQYKHRILVFGGRYFDKKLRDLTSNVKQTYLNNLQVSHTLPPMNEKRFNHVAVCIKGDVYVLGGYSSNDITDGCYLNLPQFIEKYSPVTNKWCIVALMYDERHRFCACAYMDKILLFGGRYKIKERLSSNLQFNTWDCKWIETSVSTTTLQRSQAACAIFERNVVVAGGFDYINNTQLSTVESYNVANDTWAPMPSMIEKRSSHSLVVVKRKLFVIGGSRTQPNCEFFDNVCKKFVALKSISLRHKRVEAVSIGNKILVVEPLRRTLLSYDVEKDECSEEPCSAIEDLVNFAFIKLHPY